eukprot:555429_1
MSLSDDEEPNKQSKYVKLISSDGLEFILEKECACASGFINRLIHSSTKWEETQGPITTIPLDYKSDILEIIVKYFYFKNKYDKSNEDPPDFGKNIPPSKVVDLLMAAHYLDC